MDSKAIELLELPQLLASLRRYLFSPLGEWQLQELEDEPLLASQAAAEESLAELGEAMSWLREDEGTIRDRDAKPPPSFQGLRDIRQPLARLPVRGTVLEVHEIYSTLELLERASEARSRLIAVSGRRSRLGARAESLEEFRPLLRRLAGKVLANGEVADNASPALARMRRQIEQHRSSVQQSLERFARSLDEQGSLQDDYVTIRNGRLVVPVKAGSKGSVPGVIHSASSSGQTVFIEPLATIDLNNELVHLLEEEQREVYRILLEMCEQLRQEAPAIESALLTMAQLELVFAKARFGREFDCCIPVFSEPAVGDSAVGDSAVGENDKASISLKNARHPLLQDVLGGDKSKVVPLSLTLEGGNRVLLISGPNAGGKTIILKTVGLSSLMAQAGLPVPADDARLPWFEEVLADIGDSQSIAESLSTFSAHIARIKHMMERATARSLVLLDELGAATDPHEGGALGVALVDYFREQGGFTIASTHLPELKAYASANMGVTNASVGFDEETLSPNYRLTTGIPGQSAGLDMALKFGLPEAVVERARRTLDPRQAETVDFLHQLRRQVEQYESATSDLRAAERSLEERKKKLVQDWDRRENAKLRELERQLEARFKQFEVEHQAALDKLAEQGAGQRTIAAAQRRQSQRKRELREDFQAAAAQTLGRTPDNAVSEKAPAQLEEGANVRLKLGTNARVLRRVSDGLWEVQAGQLRLRVSTSDISRVLEPDDKPAAGLPARVTLHTEARSAASLSEINVIGRTAEEARSEVDKFLDDAVVADLDRVRIIHGHGMQVLRRTLWEMFASHPQVQRHYQAEPYEGGAGATIVEVRS